MRYRWYETSISTCHLPFWFEYLEHMFILINLLGCSRPYGRSLCSYLVYRA